MANLATVGSHAVNGVAALHSELLKQTVLQGLRRAVAGAVPQRDQRRDAAPLPGARQSGPRAAARRDDRRRLVDRLDAASKRSSRMPTTPRSRTGGARSSAPTRSAWRDSSASAPGIVVDPAALFDIQVKRIHEYKRQHLNVLHIITLYHRLQARTPASRSRRAAFIFGGKAAPGYCMAKLHHRLINARRRDGEQRPGRRTDA